VGREEKIGLGLGVTLGLVAAATLVIAYNATAAPGDTLLGRGALAFCLVVGVLAGAAVGVLLGHRSGGD
jgi:hypothetical protein